MPRARTAIAVLVTVSVAGGAPTAAQPQARLGARAQPSIAQLVGQHLMGRFEGTRPGAAFLRRIERGELGSVILVSPNITSTSSLRATVAELQRAARRGGQPPLLIAIDQEGGSVKRLASAPPFQSARSLGARGDAPAARRSGLATGRSLRTVGINVDLAPVLDVPDSRRSFLGSRAFGRDPVTVERAGVAFAIGVQAAGVAATAKHFPGLGTARANTDAEDVTVTSPQSVLVPRLAPFAVAVRSGVRLVMISSARYPALDPSRLPALLSPAIVDDLLRRKLGFHGVIVTDTMGARGVSRFPAAPVRATRAGVDVLLYSASEEASVEAYRILAGAARSGSLDPKALRPSYERVLRLKSWLSG